MALHPDFPRSPYSELLPDQHLFPAAKGREDLDLPQRMARLLQCCEDTTAASVAESGPANRFVYVDQQSYERNPPRTFAGLVAAFRDYQGG